MSFCIFLIFQAEKCLDNFNHELAIKFCERALGIEPDNLEVLEMAGSVYLETGDMDKAKSVSLSWMLLMKAFSSVFRSFNLNLNFVIVTLTFLSVTPSLQSQGSTLGSF